MRYIVLIVVSLIGGLLLAACGSGDASKTLAETVPLDGDRLTLVFFYTDG